MGKKLPEEMIYTITSGFYPEMFSGNTKWRGGKGSGRKGMQWRPVRGWSKNTLREVGGKKIAKEGYSSFLGRMAAGKSWDDAYKKLSVEEQAGVDTRKREGWEEQEQAKANPSNAEMEASLTYYKFMGNNENYKLWGTKVWWQEGQRHKKEEMESSINDWMDDTNKLSLHLQKMYTGKEGELIKLAKKLAKEVFENALHEENLRKDLKTVGDEAEVPEEEREEAGSDKKGPVASEVKSISKDLADISRARGLDVKYRMKNGTSLYMDSTEMALTQGGQHGVTKKVAKDMKLFLDNLDTTTKGWKGELLIAVTKMFEASIDKYNPLIKKIMGVSASGKNPKQNFKDIMTGITQKNKKLYGQGKGAPDPRATVRQIAQHAGITMAAKGAKTTRLKYVVHTIVNLMGDANANYRQGHLVGNIGGENTYASVAMQLEESSGYPQFDKAFMKENTTILQGENHLLAIQKKDRNLSTAVVKLRQSRQIQAFSNGKIIGIGANGQKSASANAQLGARQTCRQSTVVTFAPKAMGAMIDEIERAVGDNINKNHMTETAKGFMKNKKENKLAQSKDGNVKFWAMPYLGLMEYPKKSKE
jgi:hypothetical protein